MTPSTSEPDAGAGRIVTVSAAPSRTARAARAAGVLGALFVVLTVLVALRPSWLVVDVDARVADGVRSPLTGHDGWLQTLRVVTWLGHPLVVDVVVLALAVVLWRRYRPVAAVSLVVTGLASLLVRSIVKTAVDRPRPVPGFSTAAGASFPSGHTAGAAFVAVAAVVLWRRAWVAALGAAYVVVVGASRVLLDVHWLSDVVGGLLLGATFALLLPAARTQIGERWPRTSGATLPDR
jgi:membrane-associated phospholipid phosphatase